MSTVQLNNKVSGNAFTAQHHNLMIKSSLAPSFIIFREGSTYYRRNATTGQVDSSMNFTTLLNGAISALASGGLIFIRDGIYVMTGQINVASNIEIVGDSWATILQANWAGAQMIDGQSISNVRIENLTLDANNTAQTFIYLRNITDLLIRHVKMINCTNTAIAICTYGSSVERIVIDKCHIENAGGPFSIYSRTASPNILRDIWITNNFIDSLCAQGIDIEAFNFVAENIHICHNRVMDITDGGWGASNGIVLGISGGSTHALYNFEIIDNIVTGCGERGILIADAYDGTIIGNVIKNNGTDGIDFHSTTLSLPFNIEVIGNTILNNTDAGIRVFLAGSGNDHLIIKGNVLRGNDYGIHYSRPAVTPHEQIIAGNDVEGNTTSSITFAASPSTDCDIHGNVGYRTENWFTAVMGNGTQTTGAVAHGLAGTPTVVVALGRDSDTTELYCSARDANNVTIMENAVVGGDRTIDIYVKFIP